MHVFPLFPMLLQSVLALQSHSQQTLTAHSSTGESLGHEILAQLGTQVAVTDDQPQCYNGTDPHVVCEEDLATICTTATSCDYLGLQCENGGYVVKGLQCGPFPCFTQIGGKYQGAGFRSLRALGASCSPGCGERHTDTPQCGSETETNGGAVDPPGGWCHNGALREGTEDWQDYSETCSCPTTFHGSECKQVVSPAVGIQCSGSQVYSGVLLDPMQPKVEAECFLDYGQKVVGVDLLMTSHRIPFRVERENQKVTKVGFDLYIRVRPEGYGTCTETLGFLCDFTQCTESLAPINGVNGTKVECTKSTCSVIDRGGGAPCTGCPPLHECGIGCPYFGAAALIKVLQGVNENVPVSATFEPSNFETGNVVGKLGIPGVEVSMFCNSGLCVDRPVGCNVEAKYLCESSCQSADSCSGADYVPPPEDTTNLTPAIVLYSIVVFILIIATYVPLYVANKRSRDRKLIHGGQFEKNNDLLAATNTIMKAGYLTKKAEPEVPTEALDEPMVKDGVMQDEKDPHVVVGVEDEDATPKAPSDGLCVGFINVGYTLKLRKRNTRCVFSGATGTIRSGQVCALMGPSGAGKSTLLDILALRPKKGEIEGQVFAFSNGKDAIPVSWKDFIGYVMQDDRIHSTETVFEAVWFAAKMRLKGNSQYIIDQVWKTLEKLRIAHIAHSQVGSSDAGGISGGERRRLSVAMELVAEPSVLLLDEPSSGLDSSSTLVLMEVLREIADSGTAVILSIHQPAEHIFMSFDTVVLMSRGANLAYIGSPKEALGYFVDNELAEPRYRQLVAEDDTLNPADMVSMVLAQDDAERFDSVWRRSELGKKTLEEAQMAQQRELEKESVNSELYERDFPGRGFRFALLCERNLRSMSNSPSLLIMQNLVSIVVALLCGLFAFQITRDLMSSQMTIMLFIFYILFFALSSLSSMGSLIEDVRIFARERQAGFYSTGPYLLAKALCDQMPLRVIPAIFFSIIVYWMMGLWPAKADEWGGVPPYSLTEFVQFTIVLIFVNTISVSVCLLVSTFAGSVGVANLIVVTFIIYCTVMCGAIIITGPGMYFRYSSYFFYAWEVMVCNEYKQGTYLFNPQGVGIDGGLLAPATAMTTQFQLDPERIPLDIFVLFLFTVFFQICTYTVLKFRKYRR